MKTYDAIIAGAGLIGSAIALELARKGLRVAVFDPGPPGQEASWASAGILSPAPENPGMITAVPLAKESMALYPDFIASVEEASGLPTGYRAKGTIEAHFSANASERVSTVVALHRGLGLAAEALSSADARHLEPALSEDVEAAILRPDEASVDNRLLSLALVEAARRAGARFVTGAVESVALDASGRCTGFAMRGEEIAASVSIVAAGAFSARIAGVEKYAPVVPAKGQMLSLRCAATRIERVLWSENIYLVPRNDGRILAGATVEHVGFDKAVTAQGVHQDLAGALELAPILASAQIEESWAGLRPDTPDHLPILGATDVEGLLIATGHYRSGVLLTPATAQLIARLVLGAPLGAEYQRFSPMRFLPAGQSAQASASTH